MTRERIAAAADLLLDARRSGRRIAALPADLAPKTRAEADAICEAMGSGMEGPLGGWKVGKAYPDRGLDAPFCGRLPAALVLASGARVPHASLMRPVVEAEIAFRLGADLPPRETLYTRDDIAGAVAGAVPAIEIPESRLADDHPHGGLGMVADQGYAGRLVVGAGMLDWRDLDLNNLTAVLSIDGKEAARGTGARAMGDPLAALVWLANHRAERGDGLGAGMVVNTGSLTGICRTDPGAHVAADFGPLGRVELFLD